MSIDRKSRIERLIETEDDVVVFAGRSGTSKTKMRKFLFELLTSELGRDPEPHELDAKCKEWRVDEMPIPD